MTISLPFQNGEKAISAAEAVAKRSGPWFAEQTLSDTSDYRYSNSLLHTLFETATN